MLEIDYSRFLAEQDLVYYRLTENWHEGAFTGNGLLGAMIYLDDERTIRIEVGRTDVVDHRDEYELAYGRYRLPIGQFLLRTPEPLTEVGGRLKLHEAVFQGVAGTATGPLGFRFYAHALFDVMVLEVAKGGSEYELVWRPELSVSPRYYRQSQGSGYAPPDYEPNPAARQFEEDGAQFSYQPLLAGGGFCVAWKKVEGEKTDRYFITIGNSHPQDISIRQAKQKLQLATAVPHEELWMRHVEWWDKFYRQSFVSLPDQQFESFWWIQQYKLGSATRADAPAIDLMGPWYRHTPWAAYWFNLNLQLTYSPLYSSNRLDLAESLLTFIDNNRQQLIRNAPPEHRHNAAALGRNASFGMESPIDLENPQLPDTDENRRLSGAARRGEQKSELGNLTWLLYYYWLHASYAADGALARGNLYPLLKRAVNYYLNIREMGEDGRWHLPVTYSPEYPGGFTRDCNYDLALLRWGCQALLDMNRRYGLDDPLAAQWEDTLANLVDYPTDENGLRIGRDAPFAQSHRHFSHLLMWYPLHVMRPTPENVALVRKSIDHWLSFEDALQGYSFTGSASMLAKMGHGERAYRHLKTFMTDFLKPNTMYLEAGPVIETPLSAVTAINELLVQSWGGVIRVYPAAPDSWRNAIFHHLRTHGAFLISAERANGRTRWVAVESEAGGTCRVDLGAARSQWQVSGIEYSEISDGRDGVLEFATEPGQAIRFVRRGESMGAARPVEETIGQRNPFGAKSGS